MQDRFVGDIGDFGKYGLLRALTGLWDWEREGPLPEYERLSLGVVWYRNKVLKGGANEGQNVGYLFDPQSAPLYSDLDPKLYASLKEIVCSRRSVDGIEKSGILEETEMDAYYYSDFIPAGRSDRKKWKDGVEKWKDSVIENTKGEHIIFLDPDTGIASLKMEGDVKEGKRFSTKHVYLEEMRLFINQTLVVYQHHAHKQEDRDGQLQQWGTAAQEFPESPRILTACQRAFTILILPAARHADLIDKRLGEMLDGPWKQHFTLHEAKD